MAPRTLAHTWGTSDMAKQTKAQRLAAEKRKLAKYLNDEAGWQNTMRTAPDGTVHGWAQRNMLRVQRQIRETRERIVELGGDNGKA